MGVRGPWPAGAAWNGSRCCRQPLRERRNRFKNGQQRLAAQAGVVGRRKLADLDLLHALKALHHHFHVRLHHGLAELAELFHILLVDNVAVLLLRDAELLQAWG